MAGKSFGMIVAGAVTTLLMANVSLAQTGAAGGAPAKAAGKCVHNCSGNAECKGNGSTSCKGKNSCANEGIVPKACSSKKSEADCTAVLDKKKDKLCTWQEG